MPIEITCECGKKYHVPEKLAGKTARCKACGNPIAIPIAADELEEVKDEDDLTNVGEPYALAGGAPQRPVTTYHTIAPLPPAEDLPRGGLLDRVMDDGRTVASTPGQMQMSILRYLRCYPSAPGVFLTMLALGLYAMSHIPKLGIILILAGLLTLIQELVRVRHKLLVGDANAAIIIQKQPWLVAVYTDLRTGPFASKPCIKIVRVHLGGMIGGPPQVGMKLVAASLYHGTLQADAWTDFDPTIAHCAVSNQNHIHRTFTRIPARDWRQLEAGLQLIESKRPGLYKLWLLPRRRLQMGKIWRGLFLTVLLVGAILFTLMMLNKPGGWQPANQPPANRSFRR